MDSACVHRVINQVLSDVDTYERVASGFQETIEAITSSVDVLSGPLEQATQRIVSALLNDGKLMCCGTGANAAMVNLLIGHLANRYEHERPALPAINLCPDSATLAAIVTSSGSNEIFSKQVRALGHPGDVLLTIANEDSNNSIIQAISAAHEREICVVSVCGQSPIDISALLLPEDVELSVQAQRPARVTEIHAIIIHQLCEFIDNALFGTYDT